MTRQEAEEKIKEINETELKWFCPMINAQCNRMCINYEKPYLYHPEMDRGLFDAKAHTQGYYIEGNVCTNAMFIVHMSISKSCS